METNSVLIWKFYSQWGNAHVSRRVAGKVKLEFSSLFIISPI